ncbi:MAG: class I SAM-dependent methyltransferase [Treponema sp.]|nr:class I SAM-dependent methyltransferase [Treponema sp.]
MENKITYQAQLFANRLAKKYRSLRKWARKNRVYCYRLYDRDIPEIPLAADMYEFLPDGISDKMEASQFLREEEQRVSANDPTVSAEISRRRYLHLFMYERPYETTEEDEKEWLNAMTHAAKEVLFIEESHIFVKTRRRQKGESQYEKIESGRTLEGIAAECGQLFKVNLSDYLDTGLFFDHRPLRSIVRETAAGKSVLNLFCYTGSFSVYAAEGKASHIESVDLSNTYLRWAEENMRLNGFSDAKKYVFTRSDVISFLQKKCAEKPVSNPAPVNRYDIIILDPPTFSNSKSTTTTLDINRDWPSLVSDCLTLLKPNGTLYFSTNSRRLRFDSLLIPEKTQSGANVTVMDITAQSLPEDYKGTKNRRCWKLTISSAE